MTLFFGNTAVLLPWIVLALAALLASPVVGKCQVSSSVGGELRAHCDIAVPEDYAELSSLNPEITNLVCNVPGLFNDTFAKFGHLRRLQTLKFEAPSRYTLYTLAGIDGVRNDFSRVEIFENLTRLENLTVNVVLRTVNWDLLRYLPKLRLLDVSHTQMDQAHINGLLLAIQKYKPPLEYLMMRAVQRVHQGMERIEMGSLLKNLRNIPLKSLDLLENQAILLLPGLSVYLPELQTLRVAGNRFLSARDHKDSESAVCFLIDLLLHPSGREATFHLPGYNPNVRRGRRDLEKYVGYFFAQPQVATDTIQKCLGQIGFSSGNFLCEMANCFCGNFISFPCELFKGWRLWDFIAKEKECHAGIILPVPHTLTALSITNVIATTHRRIGLACLNPTNNVTHVEVTNGQLKGLIFENFGLKGLQKIKYFNVQNNGILVTEKMSLVADMPCIEVLLLGKNSISLELPEKMDFLQSSSLRSLDMQECQLRSIPRNSLMSLKNLETLNISGNSLEDFNVHFTAMKRFKHLNLSNNHLRNLNEEMRQSLDSLTETNEMTVDLSLNPLECNCEDIDFVRWLKTTNVRLARLNLTTCFHPIEGKISLQDIDFKQFHRMCIHFDVIISSIGSSAGIALVICCIFLIYKRRWRLRYWIHTVNETLRREHEVYPCNQNNFVYNAFVAYSSRGDERPWVHTTLREKLEGEHGLKLCMYHRNFKVGRDLADTIVEGINSSNKILLILSPTFLSSCWCEFEVRMAYEKLVKERRDAVILVVYSRLDQAGVRLPKKLARLLEKRIYIEWTEDPDGQKLFWSRLVQAIQGDKRHDAFADLCDNSA